MSTCLRCCCLWSGYSFYTYRNFLNPATAGRGDVAAAEIATGGATSTWDTLDRRPRPRPRQSLRQEPQQTAHHPSSSTTESVHVFPAMLSPPSPSGVAVLRMKMRESRRVPKQALEGECGVLAPCVTSAAAGRERHHHDSKGDNV